MKRAGNLWPAIIERDNLVRAFHQAARGKRHKPEVRRFAADLDANLERMRGELDAGTFETGRFHVFKVYDPKERTIHAARFPERVFHHALMNLCEPVFERHSVFHSYACRKGKGRLKAIEVAQQAARRHPWHLKLDIRKYFESIPHDVLLDGVRRLFKDPSVLCWLERIICGRRIAILAVSETGLPAWTETGQTTTAGKMPAFRDRLEACPPDSLTPDGLPIGSLTSQHLANFYLGALDRFCQAHPAVKAYARYMDDFVCWGDDKSALVTLGREIETFVSGRLGLALKHPPCPQPTRRGMDFLGFRIDPHRAVPNRRTRVRYRRRVALLARLHDEGRVSEATLQQRLTAMTAFLLPARSHGYRLRALATIRSAAIGLEPGAARRQLEQQRDQLPLREPQQQQPRQPQQQQRFPLCPQLRPNGVDAPPRAWD